MGKSTINDHFQIFSIAMLVHQRVACASHQSLMSLDPCCIWKDLNAHLRTSCSFLRSSLATRCTVLVTHLRKNRVAGVLALERALTSKMPAKPSRKRNLTRGIQHGNTSSNHKGPIGSWSSREFTDIDMWYVVLNGCSGSSLKNSSLVTTGTFASRVPVTAKASEKTSGGASTATWLTWPCFVQLLQLKTAQKSIKILEKIHGRSAKFLSLP